MEALNRCDSKYEPSILLPWLNEPEKLEAMMYVATGWQPGHPLTMISANKLREEFFKKFLQAYQERNYPLRDLSPQEAVLKAEELLGILPDMLFSLDCDKAGTWFLSNGLVSKPLLTKPAPGKKWHLKAPKEGQGPEHTLLTDRVRTWYCTQFFTESEHQRAVQQSEGEKTDLSDDDIPMPEAGPSFAAAGAPPPVGVPPVGVPAPVGDASAGNAPPVGVPPVVVALSALQDAAPGMPAPFANVVRQERSRTPSVQSCPSPAALHSPGSAMPSPLIPPSSLAGCQAPSLALSFMESDSLCVS